MSLLELTNGLHQRLADPGQQPIMHGPGELRAVVLLGGSVRSSELSSAARRSLLDLPIDPEHSLLDLWCAHATVQATFVGLDRLPLRVITNGLDPNGRPQCESVTMTVERDPSEMRGTGGVLRDIVEAYPDDSFVAVANAAQILYGSLPHLLAELADTGADVALVAHEDGTPSGLLLARCRSLRVISRIGFVDMKEQALPMIARESDVRVVRRRRAVGLPVRTHRDYIRALRQYHRPVEAPGLSDDGDDPFTEDWSPLFSLCESGAEVHPSARLLDSVVLRGARIERGAVVARSVVCPGAVVHRDQVVSDRLVAAPSRLRGWGVRQWL